MKTVENFLEKKQIYYSLFEHPAVFTCEESDKYCSHIPGVGSKNLFLRDDKKRRYLLFILSSKKRADLKKLGVLLGIKRLSFANDQELKDKLGLQPGAVSIFGLLNDENAQVELFLDKDFYESELVHFHPNRNTASIVLKKEMLETFLTLIPHDAKIVDLN